MKTVQKSFDKYAERAKIDRTVSPHVLRHNFASMAAENGMSIFHLQLILGHADISTTRKYVQISEGSLSDEHRRFSPLTRINSRSKGGVRI
ncbi:tyrosine-type recombinase/integrase [Paenibacillus sp. 453mf]|uniref:tyrosine-type recombinase/integrase n=1 Tax=Paenibacillus sp. 453mf TaxID=1761874 RepID=UPI00244E7DF1|nr:tyrosine-type recombinase/integrase [Paenibacillus sp. 453mf]